MRSRPPGYALRQPCASCAGARHGLPQTFMSLGYKMLPKEDAHLVCIAWNDAKSIFQQRHRTVYVAYSI